MKRFDASEAIGVFTVCGVILFVGLSGLFVLHQTMPLTPQDPGFEEFSVNFRAGIAIIAVSVGFLTLIDSVIRSGNRGTGRM